MLTEDFYGKKQFIWWTGVVENTKDPIKLGSIQVRIIGLHPFLDDSGLPNKNLLPTDKLPWAQVSLPITGAKTTSNLREGDWVFGFFQDGEYAQMPVVIGTFPGIQGRQSQIVYNESVRIKTNPPRVPEDVVVRSVDEPTTARMARGVIEGTLVNRTNNQLAHVCDISTEVKLLIGKVKVAIGTILRTLKEAVRKLLALLGLEPSGETRKVVQFLKEVYAKIKEAQEFYQEEIQPWIELATVVAKYVRAIIAYVLSLPDRLSKFLKECLAAFTKSIISEFSGLKNELKLGNDLKQLNKDFNSAVSDIKDAAKDLVQTVSKDTQNFVDSLTGNPDPEKVAEIESVVTDFIENNFSSEQQKFTGENSV